MSTSVSVCISLSLSPPLSLSLHIHIYICREAIYQLIRLICFSCTDSFPYNLDTK